MALRPVYVFTSLCVIVCWISASAVTPQTYILEENCGNPIAFSESMVLTVSNLTSVTTCNTVIQCNNINNKLLIDFTAFNLVDNCNETKLSVVDDLGNRIAGPLCRNRLNTTVFQSGDNVAHFQYSSTSPNSVGKNMSVIITSFNMGTNDKCASFEFQCANKLCIAKDLICNHYNECSDNSDETLAACASPSSNTWYSTTWLIVGMSILGVIVVVVVVVLVVKCRRRRDYLNVN